MELRHLDEGEASLLQFIDVAGVGDVHGSLRRRTSGRLAGFTTCLTSSMFKVRSPWCNPRKMPLLKAVVRVIKSIAQAG